MDKLKVVRIDSDSIEFENGVLLYSHHESDCCESHWLSFSDLTLDDFNGLEFDLTRDDFFMRIDGLYFSDLTLDDFNGLEFDLTRDDFFMRIDGYGIGLLPINGHPVRIPGYGSNNGYYSDQLDLILTDNKGFRKEFDITNCQSISG